MMIMQRILNSGAVRRVTAVRPFLLGVTVPDAPPLVLCVCVLRLCPPPPPAHTGLRCLSTSAYRHAVQQPKHQEEEAAAAAAAAAAQASSSTPPSPPPPPPIPPHTQREEVVPEEPVELDPLQDKSIGLVQRFKRTFKQYGKVMIPVHLATSSVWFGTFYYAAMKGVNVVPFLELMGLPESLVGLLKNSSSGYALTAYAMYKIATPARYTVTLGGTSLSITYLRKHGYLSTPPPVKEYIQDRMEETKERLSEKMEETKELFSEKMEVTKDKFSEKMEETKDKFSEKLQETKDRVSEGKNTFFRKKND